MDGDAVAMVPAAGRRADMDDTHAAPARRATPAPVGRNERPQLELVHLSKAFGPAVTAVDDLCLELNRGEFVSLLGPSGCGKTTTLRMIAGFESPTAGEIYCDGHLLNAVPPHRRPVNTVFQNYALFPHMRVFDNVAYGLRARGVPSREIKTQVAHWLETIGLIGYERRFPRELSGGQQQRVALARSLINRPSVLLLDEPLGALDLKLRKQMQLVLMNLRREVNITFVYVTHDQEEALTMSSRIAVLNAGRLEQLGSPEELYYRPRTRFVAGFVGENNVLPARVVDVDGDVIVADTAGVRVTCRMSDEEERLALRPGAPLIIAVRPEALHLAAMPDAHTDALDAWVDEVIFAGSDLKLVAQLRDGTRVMAKLTRDHGALVPQHGEQIALSWHTADALGFADGEAGS